MKALHLSVALQVFDEGGDPCVQLGRDALVAALHRIQGAGHISKGIRPPKGRHHSSRTWCCSLPTAGQKKLPDSLTCTVRVLRTAPPTKGALTDCVTLSQLRLVKFRLISWPL
ncbi:hypothetical protein U8L64_01635, partial [Pseudomonas sp. FIP_A4]|uniref:hypothetical protein n=1 Tax=Pseudomonas sp. FIP_A4 TaxID=3070684 RepID=UPI002FD4DF28